MEKVNLVKALTEVYAERSVKGQITKAINTGLAIENNPNGFYEVADAESIIVEIVKKASELKKPLLEGIVLEKYIEAEVETVKGKTSTDKKGTLVQAREYLEMLGKSEDFADYVNHRGQYAK